MSSTLPPIEMDDKDFELMCCDILSRLFGDKINHPGLQNRTPAFRLYGRKGQNQKGLDVISRKPVDSKGYYVAQCKAYSNTSKQSNDRFIEVISSDIERILCSDIIVSTIIIMTTLKLDTKLQDFERTVIEKYPNREILFYYWEDLAQLIQQDNYLLNKWYLKSDEIMINKTEIKKIKCPQCRDDMTLRTIGEESYYFCKTCGKEQKINVFVSLSSPINKKQIEFRDAIHKALKQNGFDALTLGHNIYDMDYPLRGILNCMEQCYGLLTLGFRRNLIHEGRIYKKTIEKKHELINENDIDDTKNLNNRWLTSPFCHMESAMAYQLNLPILIFREKGVMDDGIFEKGNTALYLPEIDLIEDLDNEKKQQEVEQLLEVWAAKVREKWNESFADDYAI